MPSDLFAPKGSSKLDSALRGLHATPAAPLPFLRGVVVRSFLLEREKGNIIIYNAPGVTAAAREIQRPGKPDRLLVNHWHEAMYGAPNLDVPIFVHERDRSQTSLPIAGVFSDRATIGDDLELIPTPGHTAGTTTFLWNNGEHRLLFPGDSIWVQCGEWKAVLLGESSRSAYIASLIQIMELDFDFLVPWGGEDGEPYGYYVTRSRAQENLGRIVERLKAGENA